MAATKRPVLIGGPLDGCTIAPGPRPVFIYCAEAPMRDKEARATAFARPGRGRHLYHFVGIVGGLEQFVYAGHTMRRCPGCGGYVKRQRRRCAFCGHFEPVPTPA